MSTLPQKAPGSLSQAYQLLALVALSGELPASQLSRLAGGTSYKENVVKSLKRQRLLLSAGAQPGEVFFLPVRSLCHQPHQE